MNLNQTYFFDKYIELFCKNMHCYLKECTKMNTTYCSLCGFWWCFDHMNHNHETNSNSIKLCQYMNCYKNAINPHNYCSSHLQVVFRK